MACTIQVRVDDELKTKSDNLFKELGTDTTTAIRMFLTQAVANNGFPFEIKRKTEIRSWHYQKQKCWINWRRHANTPIRGIIRMLL